MPLYIRELGVTDPGRIAMWSGPRTVSTALMRAWENRPDTAVTDEPLYAFYLDRTGLDHPGRDAVIASQPTDWRVVLAQQASGPLPGGAVIGYAKHMTHHLLPEVDRAALAPFRHAHLIRDPRELLASYARVRAEPTLDDLGLRQQALEALAKMEEIAPSFSLDAEAKRGELRGPALETFVAMDTLRTATPIGCVGRGFSS
jgi:hypothetical protein